MQRVAHNERFRFTAKLWQKFTHGTAAPAHSRTAAPAHGRTAAQPHSWTEADVREVQDGFGILRDANLLGAILAQFPWSFKPSPGSIELRHFSAPPFLLVLPPANARWSTAMDTQAFEAGLKADGYTDIETSTRSPMPR